MAHYKKTSIDVTTGVTISPGYNNFLNNTYGSVTGGMGWYDLGLGAKFRITDQASITPAVDFMVNYFTGSEIIYYQGYYYDYYTSYTYTGTNLLFLPKVTGRFQFEPDSPSWFAEVELNDNIPGSDLFDFRSGGMGYGIGFGFEFKDGLRVQANYQYIPVKTYFGTENMGGLGFRAGWSF